MQWDGPVTMLSPLGTRKTTTFRKLPTQMPKRKEQMEK